MSIGTLNDRVVVKLDKGEEMTEGGLYIPEKAQEDEPATGTVKVVSNGLVTPNGIICKPILRPGDRVLVREYGGTEIKLNLEGEEETYFVFRNADIFGIIEEC